MMPRPRPWLLTAEDILQRGAYAPYAAAKLELWATRMAGRFNGPVYLVGSALHSPVPRDVDVRIVISDHAFFNRYRWGADDFVADNVPATQEWVDDMAKMSEWIVINLRLNIDVQVWPRAYWRDNANPSWPPILLADVTPRWRILDGKAYKEFR